MKNNVIAFSWTETECPVCKTYVVDNGHKLHLENVHNIKVVDGDLEKELSKSDSFLNWPNWLRSAWQ